MSRLIDANANREKFKEVVYRTLNDCNITTKKKFNLIMTAFDNMPTAYDVEKVVEDITRIGKAYCDSVKCSEECTSCCDHYSIMKAIIDAVRRGGVE